MIYFVSSLNRYVMKTFFKWFGICFLGIGSIVLLIDMIELFRRMMTRPNLSFLATFEVLFFRMPGALEKMLPFIVLASTMLTLSRLSHSSEIVVMRAMGISLWQILLGLIGGILVFGLIHVTLVNPIRATLTERLYFLEEKLFGTKRNTISVNESGLWLRELIHDEDRIFHAPYFNLDSGQFKNVSFYIFDRKNYFIKRINAEEVSLAPSRWILKGIDNQATSFSLETEITLQKIRESNAVPETLSFWQLPSFIRLLEKSGMSSLIYQMYYNKVMAQVGLMVVMILLAAGFCLRPIRSSRTGVLVSICLLTGLSFYFMTDFVYALGLGGRLPPLLAVWFPALIGLFLSFALLLHVEEGKIN